MSNRQELQTLWEGRREDAERQLDVAKHQREEIEEDIRTHSIEAEDYYAYRQALKAETLALTEYARVLRIYTYLLIYGKVPDEMEEGTRGV